MTWNVTYRDPKRIERVVVCMRPATRRAVGQAVGDLIAEGPWPQGWHVKELKGDYRNLMALRLDYRHRMIYAVYKSTLTIEIIEVSTREGAYG